MNEAPSSPSAPRNVDVSRDERHWSPPQIAMATLFGTPIAGALLFAFAAPRRGAVVLAVATTNVALVLGMDANGFGPLTLIASPVWAIVAFVAARAVGMRGAQRSSAVVVAVVVAVWAGLALAGRASGTALGWSPASPLEIFADSVAHSTNERVRYVDGASRADAERVSRALVAAGYFTEHGGLLVEIDRPHEKLRMHVTVRDDYDELDVERARKIIHDVVFAIEPSECVVGRIVTRDGRLASSNEACPRSSLRL